jgi:hypothetical protein
MIDSGGKQLCYVGDLAHHPALLLQKPLTEFKYDTNPKQSARRHVDDQSPDLTAPDPSQLISDRGNVPVRGPRPELRILNAAAQTRTVSVAGIRLDSRKSVQPFNGIFCDDISEFESYMPSHAVGSL